MANKDEQPKLKRFAEYANCTLTKMCGKEDGYLWFNRLCVLRFLDVQRPMHELPVSCILSQGKIVSMRYGHFHPEIYEQASDGQYAEFIKKSTRRKVTALIKELKQQEAFLLLVLAHCNQYHKNLPSIFQKEGDATELSVPKDLWTGNSILSYIREAMIPNACKDIDVFVTLHKGYTNSKKESQLCKDTISALTLYIDGR